MSKIVWHRISATVVLALCLSAPASGQPSLTSSGFKENFDSMGQDGTQPRTGGSSSPYREATARWSAATGIPPDQMSPEFFGIPRGPLTPVLFPSTPTTPTNNNGLNAATSTTPNDRALTTDPRGSPAPSWNFS